jgi:putative Mg2+ transporter-C (MgtC) family protein
MEPSGEGWLQLGELGLAFLLSSAIGVERELKLRSAGLRTCTLIGVSAALFTLVSKYGFADVLAQGRVVLDPSRVAAQIVSGIGFIGGGLIFVRQDVARGLTTSATVWLVAAVGMACGAGLPLLAACVTLAHFIVTYAYTPLVVRMRSGYCELSIRYASGRQVLRQVIEQCTGQGFMILDVLEEQGGSAEGGSLKLRLRGGNSPQALLPRLQAIEGLQSVTISRPGRQEEERAGG